MLVKTQEEVRELAAEVRGLGAEVRELASMQKRTEPPCKRSSIA
jgi:hypothetical protein